MSSVETGQMSAVETGQMTAAETSVLSQQKTSGLSPVNRRFGLKLGPEACQDRSGAFGMGLTHSKGPSPALSWRSKSVHNVGSGPNHRKWIEMGPESPVWPETKTK